MRIELAFWGSGQRTRSPEFWRGWRWRVSKRRPWHYWTLVRDIGQSAL